MRLLYLAECNAYRKTGVLKKIQAQVGCWRKQGHDVMLVLVSPSPEDSCDQAPSVTVVVSHPFSRYLWKAVRGYLNRLLSVSQLYGVAKGFAPDVIYYRQGVWYPGLLSVLSLTPFVVEINTMNVGQDMDGSSWTKWAGRKLHQGTQQRILSRAMGIVAVTEEISATLSKYAKPLCVIGNGFDMQSVIPESAPQNVRPQLICVGTPGMCWHGEDKIVEVARLLPECDFHLVGPDPIGNSPENVICHGYLDHSQLEGLYAQIDIGIGTMALHRKQMNEASPLKVREYAAYGLPVIVGYKDTDLHDCPFVLDVGNYEGNLVENLSRVKAFISEWKGKRIDRDIVINRLDYRLKEQKRIEFLVEVANLDDMAS